MYTQGRYIKHVYRYTIVPRYTGIEWSIRRLRTNGSRTFRLNDENNQTSETRQNVKCTIIFISPPVLSTTIHSHAYPFSMTNYFTMLPTVLQQMVGAIRTDFRRSTRDKYHKKLTLVENVQVPVVDGQLHKSFGGDVGMRSPNSRFENEIYVGTRETGFRRERVCRADLGR